MLFWEKKYIIKRMENIKKNHSEPLINQDNPEIKNLSKPKKKQRKLKENPFEDMKMHEQEQNIPGSQVSIQSQQSQWVKVKTTPLTIDIADHTKINKYYSHKSLQKYIRYLIVKTCVNPMWLTIKRQSQVQRVITIDIEIENNVFYRHFTVPEANSENSIKLDQNQQQKRGILKFLSQYNRPEKKAVFKESPFIEYSRDLWAEMFVYPQQKAKEQQKLVCNTIDLPKNLTPQTHKLYETYLLNQNDRKNNLYPMSNLPAYKDYLKITETKENVQLKNKIMVVDCEMVSCGINFQLARASIMNFQGELLYDEFFKPDLPITNYNTKYSGITEQILKNVTKKIKDLHEDLKKLIDANTILIGHSLQNDLHAMKLIHERVIDTSVLFARKNGSKLKLRVLAHKILNREIQINSHCSFQDCKATLDIVRQKIQSSIETPDDMCSYDLLKDLIRNDKKVVIIDSHVNFIKHEREFFVVEFDEIEFKNETKQAYISHFTKFFDKNVKMPDAVFSRIRKTDTEQQWEQYYQDIDESIQKIYNKSPDKTVFFLNFQVNNGISIHPQDMNTLQIRKRPFCLFVVKSE